jgi:hypothetical protein
MYLPPKAQVATRFSNTPDLLLQISDVMTGQRKQTIAAYVKFGTVGVTYCL